MNEDRVREELIQNTLDKVKHMKSAANRQLFDLEKPEEVKIEIKVDNKVAHGLFVPSKAITGIWYASEQTYRAMKKDLFAFGETLDEIKEPYNCHSCKTDLDKQFWHFCPYCGEEFLK